MSGRIRAAGVVLALAGAVAGAVVALGAWNVGYCGGLTPDVAPPGSLRSDLCRGANGDAVNGAVFAAWLMAAGAPLLGMVIALRRRRA